MYVVYVGAAIAARARAPRGRGALARWLQPVKRHRRNPLPAFMSTESPAAASATAEPKAPVEKLRKDYRPVPWSVASVDLLFSLNDGETDEERATKVTAKVAMSPAGKPGEANDIVLDCEDIELESVAIDGVAVAGYTLEDDVLTIPASAVPADLESFTLETVSLLSPAANLQLSGLYKSSGMFCTQCEAEGFRRITPYFDRPDVMSTYTVRIEADQERYPVLLSNGNKVAEGVVEGSSPPRHFAVWEDPFKKPSYLFAVVAGDLGSIKDSFTTASGREVALEIFSEHANVDQLAHAMRSVHRVSE